MTAGSAGLSYSAVAGHGEGHCYFAYGHQAGQHNVAGSFGTDSPLAGPLDHR